MTKDILEIKIDNTILSINSDFKVIKTNTPETLQIEQIFIDNYLDSIETSSPDIDGFLTGLAEFYKNNYENCKILKLVDSNYEEFLQNNYVF